MSDTVNPQRVKWVDLSAINCYLGDQKMSDGVRRIILVDMKNNADPERLKEVGFYPVVGAAQYAKGVYFLKGDEAEQRLKPKALARALGIESCPLVDVEFSEIEKIFREKINQKFGANIESVVNQSMYIGRNMNGKAVYESPGGRYFRLSESKVIAEGSSKGKELGAGMFLHAENEKSLRDCAEGFLWNIRQGEKANWKDVQKFAKVIFSGEEINDEKLHRLQEAIESAAYQSFSKRAKSPDANAFQLASNVYYGLPVARMRTAESIHLQQYSTPLPMSVVLQRTLFGKDDLKNKALLEPTIGHGGLVNLAPPSMTVYGMDLDDKRLGALANKDNVIVKSGDAADTSFRAAFDVEGFDYTIANPPFGSMDKPRDFDVLKGVRRLDHYIILKALAARKDQGRAVVIFGADSAQSDGTVKDSAKKFLNYVYDHYEVYGLVEADGRLYSRQGAGYNVRLMVIGDKKPSPEIAEVPERLQIITDYDELWDWSSRVIDMYPEPAPEINFDDDDASLSVTDVSPGAINVVGIGGAAIVEKAGAPEVAPGASDIQPWQMTKEQWEQERQSLSLLKPAERAQKLLYLNYGVTDLASEQLASAQRGDITLTQEELDGFLQRVNQPVTHYDVIEKAIEEGKKIAKEVLADYPDLGAIEDRKINEFQVPYQPASRAGDPSTMIPINMAGSTYAALNDLESRFGPIDEYVAKKLQYSQTELPQYFSPEQIDALGLAIKSVEDGRGIINADQTGIGKGRFVAAMLRYAKLQDKTPIFLTIKPELFTDIFRDISDIESRDLFKNLFIFNEGVSVKKFGTEDEILYRATTPKERADALKSGKIDESVDLVMATYSQFMRAYHTNPKAALLTEIAMNNGMILLDESHVAAGASNLAATVSQAVVNSSGTIYASATPLKGVTNFALYSKVFPRSVDLVKLPETLKAGGESLQEAISANMARDGVIIRREHDFSKLTFHTRMPMPETLERNIEMANSLAQILSHMSYLAGDVSKEVKSMNKIFEKDYEGIPHSDRSGARMQASSMNFGSRLYALNRQFLLGLKIQETVDAALQALNEGRKPVVAVENTGESLLRLVVSRRAGVDSYEAQLEELAEKGGKLSKEDKDLFETLSRTVNTAIRSVVLDNPPQFRELLEIMLDRIGKIKVQGRYGDVSYTKPESEEYAEGEEFVRELIKGLPDLPLTPIDVFKRELERRGYPATEVSGRTASLIPDDDSLDSWRLALHPKVDAVSNVAGFQNGKYEAIVITRAGSTGISLHSTDRFKDSDIRQRDFIVLQKAANIAEFLQWMGRVNRKDQVNTPIITNIESGLPAELRLTMMHNTKLRKLSANTTSNRNNANIEGEDLDLLNEIGDRIALQWLTENPNIADALDITLPSETDEDSLSRFSQEAPYINKLMGRLMMIPVHEQEKIITTLTSRFKDYVNELDRQGINPFKVDVYEWGAKKVSEEQLESGIIEFTGSTFDEPVKLVRVEYTQTIYPMRSDKLLSRIDQGIEKFSAFKERETFPLNEKGKPEALMTAIKSGAEKYLRSHLPKKYEKSEDTLVKILENKDVQGAKAAYEKVLWLVSNLDHFKPGLKVTLTDPIKGEITGVIAEVDFPWEKDEIYLLSRYSARVAIPGEETLKDYSLATFRSMGLELKDNAYCLINKENLALRGYSATVKRTLDEFDDVPEGQLTRSQLLLQGNLFRAVELAATKRWGSPILFTDEEGNRNRAVILHSQVTPEMVREIPIGFNGQDMADYVAEFFNRSRSDYQERVRSGTLKIFDSGVAQMDPGEGIVIENLSGAHRFRLSIPGGKQRSGNLLTDGALFDIGKDTPAGSLRLKLSGNKKTMAAEFDAQELPLVLDRLERGRHLGKFYLPSPDHEVIKTLKANRESAYAAKHSQEGDDYEP